MAPLPDHSDSPSDLPSSPSWKVPPSLLPVRRTASTSPVGPTLESTPSAKSPLSTLPVHCRRTAGYTVSTTSCLPLSLFRTPVSFPRTSIPAVTLVPAPIAITSDPRPSGNRSGSLAPGSFRSAWTPNVSGARWHCYPAPTTSPPSPRAPPMGAASERSAAPASPSPSPRIGTLNSRPMPSSRTRSVVPSDYLSTWGVPTSPLSAWWIYSPCRGPALLGPPRPRRDYTC